MSDIRSTGTKEDKGNYLLFKPADGTQIAAIYGHGVESDSIDPVSGVTLGYYCPHGDTILANITWAEGAPTYSPDLPSGKWCNYALKTIGLGDNQVEELAATANSYKVAIAYLVNPTSTEALVTELSGLGYSQIRGVHCREAVQDNTQAQFGEPVAIDHPTLAANGWLDVGTSPITDDTVIGKDDPIFDANYKVYKVVEVVSASPPKQYKIAEQLKQD